MSPKYRQLHSKIVDSLDFNDMPDDYCRLVWVLLPLALDGEGRGIDSPAWVRAKLFPLRSDVELAPIATVIEWLGQRDMIRRYEVSGKKFFFVPTWKQYQSGTEKEARSSIPAPENNEDYSGVSPEQVGSNSGVSPEKVLYNNNTTNNNTTNQHTDSILQISTNQLTEKNTTNNNTTNQRSVVSSFLSSFSLDGDITPDIERHFSERLNAYGRDKVCGYLSFAKKESFTWNKARGVDIRRKMVANWVVE